VTLVDGVIVLGIAVWFVVSLVACLLLGAVARLGNRVARVGKNSEKPHTDGDASVVDLDTFRVNRAAVTRRTG
jgi:hypothetical protein